MAPLRLKQQEAETANALMKYRAALDMQETEKRLAPMVGEAQAEFNNLMSLKNPEEKANAALAFSGKYAQFASTSKWGEEFGRYNEIAKQLYMDNSAIAKIQAQGGIRAELLTQKAEFDKQLAAQKADFASQLATQRGETATSIAQLRAAGKVGAAQTKFEETRGTKAAEYYDAQQAKVAEHVRTLDTIKSARSSLAKGIKQGLGEELKLDAAQIFNSVTRVAGFPDLFDTANKETLRRNYSDMALAAAARMKNQGQITESERKLLTNTVASFKNSAKAAEYIMDYMEAVAQREIEKGRFLKQKVNETGFVDQSAETEFYDANPLSFYMPAGAGDEDAPASADIDSLVDKYSNPTPEGK